MAKLTDTQCVLLSTAAKRESTSIYPLPASLKPGGGLHKAIAALTTRGLIEEHETTDATAVSRTESDYRFGLFVTRAGLTAIGVEGADRCCQSNANSSPHDAVRSLSAAV